MFAVLGILVSLALLIALAYRGWNVILLAPICALVAAILSLGDETPLLATYTQVFMPALGNYLLKFFPLFLLGAVFGKLMDDSGCARAIAHQIVEWTGKERAILAIVLACGILTYGGVSLFVVAFAVFPIAAPHVPRGQHPEAPDPGRHCARLVHLHDDRAAGHARDPERDPDPVLRHQHLRRARPVGDRRAHHVRGRHPLARRSAPGACARPARASARTCPLRAGAAQQPSRGRRRAAVLDRDHSGAARARHQLRVHEVHRTVDGHRLPRDREVRQDDRGRGLRHLGDHRRDGRRVRGADRAHLEALHQRAALGQRGRARLDAADPQRRPRRSPTAP